MSSPELCHDVISRQFSFTVPKHSNASSSLLSRYHSRTFGDGKWRAHAQLRIASYNTRDCIAVAQEMEDWMKRQGFPEQAVTLKMFGEFGIGCAASRDLKAGDIVISIPENYTVTSVDVANHDGVAEAAKGRGDLVGLALWLMYERSKRENSPWYPYLQLLPIRTSTPLLWTTQEQEELLKGSPALEKIKQQVALLEKEFNELQVFLKDKDTFTLEAFRDAFSVVISRAVFLPSADLLALVPFADSLNHQSSRSCLDYNIQEQKVMLKVDKPYKKGEQVFASYGQSPSNTDLFIRYGVVDLTNEDHYVEVEVGLAAADSLLALKKEILKQVGFSVPQRFPLYLNRFPTQLLTYMRLARIQDSALFAKINFEKDIIVNELNEYEILMLLMAECRAKVFGYSGDMDDEIRFIKDEKLPLKEKNAAKLRLSEKKILTETMAALRNRLAPIRGIPTKSGGLKDPNADISEMFDVIENIASAPAKFLSKFFK